MKRTVGSRSGAGKENGSGKGRVLAPAFLARQWKPGQSGNPAGQTAEYGEVVQLARSLSIRAMERLGELAESQDERVAAVACNAILDRAFGKPQTRPFEKEESMEERYRRMTPEEQLADAIALAAEARQILDADRRRRARKGRVTDIKAEEIAAAPSTRDAGLGKASKIPESASFSTQAAR